MNDPLKKLSSLKNTTLSEKERAELRGDIVAFMQANPLSVRNTDAVRHHTYAGPFTVFNTVKRKRMISAILLAMFALSGGVSYAAEGSLPGDMLYPVKIHINEGVQGTFAIGAKADAEFAQKQLERRAQEAEALARENRLNTEAKVELSNESKAHLKASAEAEAVMRQDKEGEEGAREVHKEVTNIILEHEEAFLELGVIIHTDGNISTRSLEVKEEANIQNNDSAKSDSSVLQQSEGSLNSRVEIYTDTSTSAGATKENGGGGAHVELESGSNVMFPNVPAEVHSEIKSEGNIKIGL